MNKSTNFIVTCTLVLGILLVASPQQSVFLEAVGTTEKSVNLDFVPGQVIVKLKDKFRNEGLSKINDMGLNIQSQSLNGSNKLPYNVFNIDDLDSNLYTQSSEQVMNALKNKENKQKTLEVIQKLKANPNIEYAEPNYIFTSQTYVSDDTHYVSGKLWGLNNTGQDGGVANVDINGPESWGVAGNNPGVKIAVLDGGVNYTHEDLIGNIAVLNESLPVAEGNIIGRNFCTNLICSNPANNDVSDGDGHGTHIAGIIAGVGKNGKGVIGACPNCKIMPVKVINSDGIGTNNTINAGIYYAVNNGAKVISMSIATRFYSQSLVEAINYATANNVLVVAAAGNCGDTNFASNGCEFQNQSLYPAAFASVVSVGSVSRNGSKSVFSTSNGSMDISAPGSEILSTFPAGANRGVGCRDSNFGLPDDGYGFCSGTSMSTPYVSGAAGLLLSANNSLNAVQVRQKLEDSARDLGTAGKDINFGFGLLNMQKALTQPFWSSWVSDNVGFTNQPYEMVEFNSKLYQLHVGQDKRIYTRFTSNANVYQDNSNKQNWTTWTTSTDPFEATNYPVSTAVHNGRVYQTHIGSDTQGRIYTRSSADGITWTNWTKGNDPFEDTKYAVYMTSFNNKLYQVHVGLDKRIYTRSTTAVGGNGELTWTNWTKGTDPFEQTNLAVTTSTFNDKLFQVHIGLNKRIYTRNATNITPEGIITWSNWTTSTDPFESTNSPVTSLALDGILYQAHRGDGKQIFTRSSTDGVNFTNWSEFGGQTNLQPTLATFGGYLYQGMVTEEGRMMWRRLG